MLYFRGAIAVLLFLTVPVFSGAAVADGGHSDHDKGGHDGQNIIEKLRDEHRGHTHGHDFEAMKEMTPAQARRLVNLMRDIGLALPPMDAAAGRRIFAQKGCVLCHAVNGVGGDVGPALNARDMPSPMNAFEFAARMWRGAAAMTIMQEEELGGVIKLTGQELADLVAFAHDEKEQKKFKKSQIPARFRKKLEE